MIDINELLAKHSSNYKYALETNRQNNSLISGKDIKPFLKEYTELLLKEAADKAQVEEDYWDPFLKPRIIVNKQSITSIINDINFD